MNDLDRLRLLGGLLEEPQFSNAGDLGMLASEIESLVTSIEEVPDVLLRAHSTFWDALEILGVQHQEAGTGPSSSEQSDLRGMAERFRSEVAVEIGRRAGS
jgi:hypothetical protein